MQPTGTSVLKPESATAYTELQIVRDLKIATEWWGEQSEPPTIRVYDEWASLEITRTTQNCGKFKKRMGDRRNGDIFARMIPCGSPRCMDCAPGRVTSFVYQAHKEFRRSETVWYTTCPHHPSVSDRLTDRRRRHPDNRFLWVRSQGNIGIFANWELTGTKDPDGSVPLDPWFSTRLLTVWTALPRVEKMSNVAWREKGMGRRGSDGNYKGFANWFDPQWDEISQRVMTRVEEQRGIKILNIDRCPPGMSPAEFFQLVEEEEYRQGSR